jgi:predicted GIY-YIG superfamily endonuclease
MRFELRLGRPVSSFETQCRTKTAVSAEKIVISLQIMKNFHYVYLLISQADPSCRYTGITSNLEARIKGHNAGQVPHTAKYRPWTIETAVAFRCREKALKFEKYLKTHSGRAFAKKHL